MIIVNDDFTIVPTIFPDKTSQIWKIDKSIINPNNPTKILFEFEDEREIIQLCQLVTLLKQYSPIREIFLYMPFLPYGRQDKDITNKRTFGLYTFATILNAMEIDEIYSLDVHNPELTEEIIHNFSNIEPLKEIQNAIFRCNAELLVFPDSGALDRYGHMFDMPTAVCDQTSYSISGDDIKDKNVLIVDDICDGGKTFEILSTHLKAARKINLYITHGIFSRGTEVLIQSGISKIFTRNGRVV